MGVFYRFTLLEECPTVLNAMRKSADSTVLKFLFAAIVLVFIFWGVGSMRADRMAVAARVNDQIVTQRQFDEAYKRITSMYQRAGAPAPPGELLRSQALSQLVDVELLVQEADRLGLIVDEAELRDSIAAVPDFQTNGHFDKDLYVQVLLQNGYKPGDFEELQRRRLLAGKVQELIGSGVHVSDEQLAERFRYENERLNLRFVRVPAAALESQVTISDEDVQKYFADNQEKYREPDRVRVKLVEFRPQDFAAAVTSGAAEVQAYYDAHLDEYRRPEEVRARHILFKLAPNAAEADKTAARQQADAVLAQAKGGADFAELATQHSQDTTAPNGGDLGTFGRGLMAPAFETAAFALEPGQISEIVETPFGLHIIKLEEKLPEHTEPLEAVRAAIVTALQLQQARRMALEKVETAHEQLLDGTDMAQVAAAAGLTVQAPPAFGRSEAIAGLGPRPELAKEAFDTGAGEVGEIVTEPSGYIVFAVEEHVPSRIPELAAVRPKVEADLRRQRASEAAKKRAETLLATLKEKPDLDALAQQEQLAVEESTQVGRFGAYVPNLGNAQELKDAAFRLSPQAPVAPAVYDAGGDAVIAVLASKVAADETRFESEKAALRQRAQQRAEVAAVQRFLDQLKVSAEILYGEGFAASAEARS
jgi:peptidyl-prolyl cis-trans isomerase D